MSVQIKRPVGRPSFVQLMTEQALASIAEGLIAWQKTNKRSATGESQNWTVAIKRKGKTGEGIGPNIEGRLLGVEYINFALFGREPGGFPPVEVILRWMRVRNIKGGIRFARARAWGIHLHGTRALKLSDSVREAIFDQSVTNAINEFAPKVAEDSAKLLVDRFIGATDNFRNVQVNVI